MFDADIEKLFTRPPNLEQRRVPSALFSKNFDAPMWRLVALSFKQALFVYALQI